jgi:hypothetical protein
MEPSLVGATHDDMIAINLPNHRNHLGKFKAAEDIFFTCFFLLLLPSYTLDAYEPNLFILSGQDGERGIGEAIAGGLDGA